MKTLVRVPVGILSSVCLVVFLLLFAVQTPAFGLWFYTFEFKKNDTYYLMDMEKEDLDAVARYTIAYLKGAEESLAPLETRVNGKTRLFYNEKEIKHMEDVRILFDRGIIIRNITAAVFALACLYFIFLDKRGLKFFAGCWRWVIMGFCGLSAVLAVFITLNFNAAFTKFHEIFFSNDLWLLNPKTDLLINMMPQVFFQDIAICIAALFVILLAAFFTLGTVIRKRVR